jgi:hypothetical protein
MRIAEAFCKMRLSEYCSAQDIDRAIAVTVESFISSQKVSCKKALSRAFAKYVTLRLPTSWFQNPNILSFQVHTLPAQAAIQAPCRHPSVEPTSASLYAHESLNIARGWGLFGGFFRVKYHLCLHLVCTAFPSYMSSLFSVEGALLVGP